MTSRNTRRRSFLRGLSIVVTVCLLMGLEPFMTSIVKAEALGEGELFVAGVDITKSNTSDGKGNKTVTAQTSGVEEGSIKSGSATLSYDEGGKPVLTLKDFVFEGRGINYGLWSGDDYIGIYYCDFRSWTIVVEGSNSISLKNTIRPGGSFGIFSNSGEDNPLTIAGEGSLTVSADEAEDYSYGIACPGDSGITITDGVTVFAAGKATTNMSCGIYGGAKLTITDNAKVIAAGGDATNENEISVNSVGIEGDLMTISNGAVVKAAGSTATAKFYPSSVGVQYDSGLSIGGDNTLLLASGDEAAGFDPESVGIKCNGSKQMTIRTGAYVTASGKTRIPGDFETDIAWKACESADGTGEWKDFLSGSYTWDIETQEKYKMAVFPGLSHILMLNANDGTPAIKAAPAFYDTVAGKAKVKLTGREFTRKDYTLTGWNTKADGTGDFYTADDTITPTDDMNLYAQWKRNQISISGAIVTGVMDKTYTGKAITQTPTVKVNGVSLKEGTDFVLSYKNNINVGTATMTVTGKGDYTGTKDVYFEITPQPEHVLKTISNATVTGVINKTATGTAITQDPKVTVDGKTLTEGVDYSLSYANNINVGTATMTITGMGEYTGTKKVTFKILNAKQAKDMSNATVEGISDKSFTGKAITQNFTVNLGGRNLKAKKEYTVTYKNNKKVGTAAVTITGKGKIKG
ncbi:MAG: InlB B-repeat-containing protein, partial [Lachnospiraceae bacterium]|nr:InlB B-repeat-containing protein [Lachnospiraceae bacterium]